MKKNAFISAAAIVALITVSGCGDNSNTAPAKQPAKPAAKNSAAYPAAMAKSIQRAKAVAGYPAAVTKSLKRANSMACANNLKQLSMSLNMFNMDNNCFPRANGVAGLQELVSQQNFPTSMLCCPAKRPEALTEKAVAFLYLGGLASPRDGNLPVAIEKPGRHGSNTAVLFANGTVKNFTVPGEYTSVTQVIPLAVPANAQAKYLDTVKQIEQQQ